MGVPDHRALGHLDDEIFTPLAAHATAQAVGTGGSHILALVAEIQQGREVGVDVQHHAAAVTAVAAVGTACGHVFFPVEGHGPVAAPASAYGNAYFIYEHKMTLL